MSEFSLYYGVKNGVEENIFGELFAIKKKGCTFAPRG
jgi:hypothetical protein